MTDNHPLTDEVIHLGLLARVCYSEDDLRTIADWQLEEVIDWLRYNLRLTPSGNEYVIENLREAMRPTTTTQENN